MDKRVLDRRLSMPPLYFLPSSCSKVNYLIITWKVMVPTEIIWVYYDFSGGTAGFVCVGTRHRRRPPKWYGSKKGDAKEGSSCRGHCAAAFSYVLKWFGKMCNRLYCLRAMIAQNKCLLLLGCMCRQTNGCSELVTNIYDDNACGERRWSQSSVGFVSVNMSSRIKVSSSRGMCRK